MRHAWAVVTSKAVWIGLAGVLVAGLSAASPAGAATVQVQIVDFAFQSASVTTAQGNAVKWTNNGSFTHTSTSNRGFWDTGDINSGQSSSIVFKNAGSFGYVCMHHSSMTGTVRIPLRASGASNTGWTLRWTTNTSTPASRAYDVQIKRPGSTTWAAFRTNTKTRSAFFNPSHNGTYSFRARTRNLNNGEPSGYSPVKSLQIS